MINSQEMKQSILNVGKIIMITMMWAELNHYNYLDVNSKKAEKEQPFRDVSRVRHCVLGCTRFPFGHIDYGTKGPTGHKKKSNVRLCKLRTPGKTCERHISEGN